MTHPVGRQLCLTVWSESPGSETPRPVPGVCEDHRCLETSVQTPVPWTTGHSCGSDGVCGRGHPSSANARCLSHPAHSLPRTAFLGTV